MPWMLECMLASWRLDECQPSFISMIERCNGWSHFVKDEVAVITDGNELYEIKRIK